MNLRKSFGYIELIFGVILLLGLLAGDLLFIFKVGGVLMYNEDIGRFLQSFLSAGPNTTEKYLFLISILNFVLMYVGFNILLFIFSIILIFQGVFDIRGE